eukprot:jgi/Chlat1/6217/Chrsp44S00449
MAHAEGHYNSSSACFSSGKLSSKLALQKPFRKRRVAALLASSMGPSGGGQMARKQQQQTSSQPPQRNRSQRVIRARMDYETYEVPRLLRPKRALHSADEATANDKEISVKPIKRKRLADVHHPVAAHSAPIKRPRSRMGSPPSTDASKRLAKASEDRPSSSPASESGEVPVQSPSAPPKGKTPTVKTQLRAKKVATKKRSTLNVRPKHGILELADAAELAMLEDAATNSKINGNNHVTSSTPEDKGASAATPPEKDAASAQASPAESKETVTVSDKPTTSPRDEAAGSATQRDSETSEEQVPEGLTWEASIRWQLEQQQRKLQALQADKQVTPQLLAEARQKRNERRIKLKAMRVRVSKRAAETANEPSPDDQALLQWLQMKMAQDSGAETTSVGAAETTGADGPPSSSAPAEDGKGAAAQAVGKQGRGKGRGQSYAGSKPAAGKKGKFAQERALTINPLVLPNNNRHGRVTDALQSAAPSCAPTPTGQPSRQFVLTIVAGVHPNVSVEESAAVAKPQHNFNISIFTRPATQVAA